ncbi:MAG: lipopolysaccharide biosynthesis protein [Kiloniellales bacterium]
MGLALVRWSPASVGFARHALALGGGNALAQLIVLGLSPVIAYLYTPAAFGLFAAYTAILYLLSVAATGQYEATLMLPRRDRHAGCLLWFVMMLCPTVALGLGLVLVVFREPLAELLGTPRLALWFWVLPVSIVMVGWYQALRYWTMRREAFSDVARNAVTRAAVGTGLACVMGVWQPFPQAPEGGLILSHILGEGVGNLLLVSRIFYRDRGIVAWPGWPRVLATARRWRHLALSLAAGSGVARCYDNLPVLAINWLFGPAAAGLYAWAERFTLLPAQLVAAAIGDVYRQRATVEYHRHGQFDGLMRQTFTATTLIALLPYAIGIALAPTLFGWIFGPVWREAGVLAQILMVGGFFSFATVPVDKATIIFQRTRFILCWHVARLGLKLAAVAATALLSLSLTTLLWLIVLVRILLYCVDLVYNYQLSKGARP